MHALKNTLIADLYTTTWSKNKRLIKKKLKMSMWNKLKALWQNPYLNSKPTILHLNNENQRIFQI